MRRKSRKSRYVIEASCKCTNEGFVVVLKLLLLKKISCTVVHLMLPLLLLAVM